MWKTKWIYRQNQSTKLTWTTLLKAKPCGSENTHLSLSKLYFSSNIFKANFWLLKAHFLLGNCISAELSKPLIYLVSTCSKTAFWVIFALVHAQVPITSHRLLTNLANMYKRSKPQSWCILVRSLKLGSQLCLKQTYFFWTDKMFGSFTIVARCYGRPSFAQQNQIAFQHSSKALDKKWSWSQEKNEHLF